MLKGTQPRSPQALKDDRHEQRGRRSDEGRQIRLAENSFLYNVVKYLERMVQLYLDPEIDA